MKTTHLEKITEEPDILISTKEHPIWQKILAALCFTITLVFLYVFYTTFDWDASSKMAHFYGNTIELAGVMFALGVRFSLMKDYYFDLDDKRYKIVKRVGPIEIGKWKDFKNLGYVSVFKNGKGILEINLWYNKNRHFNLGQENNIAVALLAGKKIAKKLQIDLLDAATDPRNSVWIAVE